MTLNGLDSTEISEQSWANTDKQLQSALDCIAGVRTNSKILEWTDFKKNISVQKMKRNTKRKEQQIQILHWMGLWERNIWTNVSQAALSHAERRWRQYTASSSLLSLGQSRLTWAHFAPPALSAEVESDDFSWQTHTHLIIICISSSSPSSSSSSSSSYVPDSDSDDLLTCFSVFSSLPFHPP